MNAFESKFIPYE